MKATLSKLTKAEIWFTAIVLTLNLLFGTAVFAQNTTPEQVDVNISTDSGSGGWYAQPWVWVIGIALFIIVLVAMVRSGSNTREV